MKRKESDIINELMETNYTDCDNLLKLSVKNFTQEKIKELDDNITKLTDEHELLIHTSEKDLWLAELSVFEEKYIKWLSDMSSRKTKKK